MLGGRRSLGDGGYRESLLADLAPVTLAPSSTPTFLRKKAAHADRLWTRSSHVAAWHGRREDGGALETASAAR